MATRTDYVKITKAEIEAWLTANYKGKWELKDPTKGIYLVKLSDEVAIKFSSTVTKHAAVRAYAKASVSMMLVSLINGRCLNAKAKDRKHFQRTKGWKTTWLSGLRHWEGVYGKCPHFYNRIAHQEAQKGSYKKSKRRYSYAR